MAAVGRALAERLGALEPAGAAKFRANAEQFAKAAAERVAKWKAAAAGAPGVVLYHQDANYLLALLGVPVLGYVEPLPGIPATAEHLSGLVARLTGKKGAVLFTEYQAAQGPEFLARNLGWPKARLGLEAGPNADAGAYFSMIDRWVAAVASAK